MFLIPVAVVGFKVWEEHKKNEAASKHAKSLESPDDTVAATTLQAKVSEEESPTESSERFFDNETDTSSVTASDLSVSDESTKSGPFSGLRRAWMKHQEQNAFRNPFEIRTNKEALTYEVMGNQGRDALPFPKIAYK